MRAFSVITKDMATNLQSAFVYFIFIFNIFKETTSESIQVCPGKIMEIECGAEEVIVASSAKFGRMQFTKCTLVEDFIGCENDVLFLVDKWCSGRPECHVEVPNDDLILNNKNCRPYLRKYIQVQYSCMKVLQPLHLNCQMPVTLRDMEGVISSHMTLTTGCGSQSAPWVISGASGQVIQLNIIDFGSEIIKRNNDSEVKTVYGFIREGKQRTAFYGGKERKRLLYQSKSNQISIEISIENEDFGFLLQYQKLGCPDLSPPAHAWYKRDGDQAVIGCEWSQKTWHLLCDGHSWSGVVGNCSEPATEPAVGIKKEVKPSSAVWLVCVVSVSFVVMVIACVIGVVCIRKYRIKQDIQKSMSSKMLPGQGHYDLDPNIEMASMLYLPYKTYEHQQQVYEQGQKGTPSDPHRPTSYLIPQDQVVDELTPIRIWERPLPDIPDKPLASGTMISTPAIRSGRTPGDGDEAISTCSQQESGTLMSGNGQSIDKTLPSGQKYPPQSGQVV